MEINANATVLFCMIYPTLSKTEREIEAIRSLSNSQNFMTLNITNTFPVHTSQPLQGKSSWWRAGKGEPPNQPFIL